MSKTAILYFTRSVREEIQRKRFHRNKWKSFHIAEYLINRTRKVLSTTGLPVFEFDTENQSGEQPIERFNNALQEIFDQGFDQIISVGNDCPTLRKNDILLAINHLDTHSLVAGPDFRGGVYLLGISKEIYQKGIILNLPWGSNEFAKKLSEQASPGSICFLDNLPDIEGESSIIKLKSLRYRKGLLITLLKYFSQYFKLDNNNIPQPYPVIDRSITRGPPFS